MMTARWFQVLRSLGLEFWLPLPVLGLLFWLGSGVLGDQLLSRSQVALNSVPIEARTAKESSRFVQDIEAEVFLQAGISQVRVRTTHLPLKVLVYEFSLTEPPQIEVAISRELGLSPAQVRALIHYEVKPDE